MFGTTFQNAGELSICFYPEGRRDQIANVTRAPYTRVNVSVSPFARPGDHDNAVGECFSARDYCEHILSHHPYMGDDTFALTDWCFLPTLIRFDPVHYCHFSFSIPSM